MSFAVLVRKDLRRELRGREAVQAALVLVVLFFVLDLFSFADLSDDPRAAAVVLWSPLLYATLALLGRGFASEVDRGTLDLLRSAPVPLAWHGLSRTIVHLVLAFGVLALTMLLGTALFALRMTWPLAAVLLLATLGLVVVGTLASALAAQARSREALLPVLVVPVLIPLLQAGLRATLDALQGAEWAALQVPMLLLVGYDLAAAGIAWLLWPIVLEGD